MGADGHPLTIRGLIDDDWAPIAELTNHYILHTSVHFSTDPVSVEELREGWEPYRVRYPFLVATLDDRFAGFAKASRWRERDAYAWTCETSIYLCDHIHGRGLGRRFYAALLDECRRRGFESAIGGVVPLFITPEPDIWKETSSDLTKPMSATPYRVTED